MQEMAPGTIPPADGASRWDGSLLGRPKDREELAIRISLFWQVCPSDLIGSSTWL